MFYECPYASLRVLNTTKQQKHKNKSCCWGWANALQPYFFLYSVSISAQSSACSGAACARWTERYSSTLTVALIEDLCNVGQR